MGYMTINNRRVAFTDEKNVLSVIRKSGIDLPTFCYHSELSTYGACRMCVVEDERGKVFASCSEVPRDGMVIYTNTPRLQHHRKMIIELLLSSHCRDCTTCAKNGVCTLQKLASQLGISEIRFENNKKPLPRDTSSDCVIRDPNKCILCGDCVRTCDEIQGLGILDFAFRGSKMQVMPAFNRELAETDCVGCGQCRAVCPTGAISIRQDVDPVWAALADKNTRVVAQIAPAVRVAIGDKFGIPKGENTLGRLVAALRRMGFDEVYDTNFGADLTVMEESAELLERLKSGENLPLFTSCCPGWVRFVETKHRDMLPYVSTCKSPMEMFGAVIKEYYKPADKEAGLETVSVAVMPCVAKKYEAARDEFKRSDVPDVDYVITTKELILMIKELGIQFDEIEPSAPDMPFSIYSGAGVIFGVTGGVTEAALRHVAAQDNETMRQLEYTGIRGLEGVKVAEVEIGEKTLRIGVVNGLGNADNLLEKIRSGEEHFDFVEVMACPYGCIGGAGQPFGYQSVKQERSTGMYKADKSAIIKRSGENPVVSQLYENGVLKGRSHELLHVNYLKAEE